MTKTLIRKVERIKNYRIFQNWKPGGGVEFARVNLIYGQNGSGKSTFASLLAGCAANAATESEPQSDSNDATNSGLQLLAAHDAGKFFFQVGVDHRDFWGRVRVFNKDFVHRNLRFEEADGPQPEALLTIGERLADAEKRLATLQQTLASEREKLNNRETEIRLKDKALEGRKTEVAKLVVESLNGTRVATYAPRSYTKKNIARRLAEFDGNPEALNHASVDLAADIAAATEKAMPSVQLESRNSLLERDILDTVHSLLTASIFDTTPIDEIAGNAARSEWVQQGLALHADLKECLFCGQELTQERRDALSAHFDESLKRLQSNIDDLVKQLKSSAQSSETYLNNIPTDTAVYSNLRADLQEARQNYKYEHAAYDAEINSIVNLLLEKRNNPFGTILLAPDLTLRAPSIDALTSVINKHQVKIDRHDVEAAEAAKRVEHFHARNFFDEYERLKAELETQKAARDRHKTTIENLEQEIATLESVDGDPVPGAEELTRGLSGLLGRDELRFSAHGSKHYVIERAGAPATHLSEGEQTAIALLYFLSSVREDKIAGDPPIIVIDDPVSSLDNEILFGASAHIWSELVVNDYVSQLFLMTHSFELFRQWLIQLESRQQHEDCDFAAYQMNPTYAQRGPNEFRRIPRLSRWETDKIRTKVLRSEYHFLFSKVAHAVADRQENETQADQMMELALIPNAARRMLEGFLSFRCPGKMGSFHVALEEVMNGVKNLDSSVRTRVEKYLHTYSHFDGGSISQPLRLDEATTVLRSLFQLMDHVDHDHISSMCKALDIEEHRLLGNFTTASPEGH